MAETQEEKTKLKIRNGIEMGSSLQNIIKQIESEVVGGKLSYVDLSYVERKYILYVMKFWLKEVASFLQNNPEGDKTYIMNLLQDMGLKLFDLVNFVPESKFFPRFNDLIINESWEIKILCRFRQLCISEISNYDNAVEEITFVNNFIDIITNSEHYKICVSIFKLTEFINNKINFKQLLQGILTTKWNLEEFVRLKKCAEKLVERDKYYFETRIKNCIKKVASEVTIERKNAMNRIYLEVFGGVIFLSEELLKIELELINFQNITEIHIISPFAIHLDISMTQNKWHGKNLILYSKKIFVKESIEINVSGENGLDIDIEGNDGVSPGADGKDGGDGHCGESGGNVLVIADDIINPNNLVIISHGGAGSNGQNGGNGIDGANGSGIDKSDMLNLFPSFGKLKGKAASSNRKTAMSNIKSRCDKSCNIDWENKDAWYVGDTYVEGESNSGEKIILSSYLCIYLATKYTYFLYKGSPGKNGGAGGKFGFGGEGGYMGCLEVFLNQEKRNNCGITIKSEDGKDGKNGTAGISGKPGLDGWDMGYADKSHWSDAYYYGLDKKTKLRVAIDTNCDDSVYCFKNKVNCDIRSCGSIDETHKKYVQTRNVIQKNKREQCSIAVKKKNISKESIVANYSSRMNCVMLSELKGIAENLGHTTATLNNITVEGTELASQGSNDMRVARYSDEYLKAVKTKFHKLPIKTPVLPSVTSISELRKEINKNSTLDSIKRILSNEIITLRTVSEKLQLIREILTHIRKRDYKELRIQAENLNISVMRMKRILSLKSVEFSGYLTNIKLDGNISKYTSKYLVEDSISRTNVIQYFTDTDVEKKKNAAHLVDYIKAFFEKNYNEKHGSKDDKFIHEFISNLILENLDHNIKDFGPCVLYLEKVSSKISQVEALPTTEAKSEQNVVHENSKENEWWITEKCKELKRRLKDKFSSKKDFCDWSQYENKQVLLNAIFKLFRAKGCQLPSYRDLVSYVECVNYYFIEINGDEEKCCLHSYETLDEVDSFFVCKTGLIYETKLLDKKYFNLDNDRYKLSILTDKILLDINTLDKEDAIQNYEIPGCFDEAEIKKQKKEICNYDKKFIELLENAFLNKNYIELLPMIKKISKKYLDPSNLLLLALNNHYKIDAIRVPIMVLKVLVSELLESYIYDLSAYNSLAWIVSTTEQKEWLFEIIYLQIENCCRESLKQQKNKIMNNLRKILDLNITIYLYENLKNTTLKAANLDELIYIIEMLGTLNCFDIAILDDVTLVDWKYILAGEYYKSNLKKLIPTYSDEELLSDAYLVSVLCNSIGDSKIRILFDSLLSVHGIQSSLYVTNLLQKLINGDYEFEKSIKYISLNRSLDNLDQIFKCQNRRDVENIVDIISSNSNNSLSVKKNLNSSKDMIINVNNQNKSFANTQFLTKNTIENSMCSESSDITSNHFKVAAIPCRIQDILTGQGLRNLERRCDFHNFTISEIKTHVKTYRQLYSLIEFDEMIYEILSLIDIAIQHTRGYKLRDTQKAAIVLILQNENSILAEVSTGEGKSLIVTAIAIIKALLGNTVDICTSSVLLAKRDALSEPPKGCKDLYNIFNISVSHNCSDDVDKRRKAYSENEVIYGQISNFQRDYLMDTFHNKNILGDRKYETVIIDEVDSMLLDKGNNMLYLSHDLPGLDRLEKLYVFLWQIVTNDTEQFRKSEVKDIVINSLFKTIIKDDLHVIDQNLPESTIEKIWRGLYLAGVIDKTGVLNVKSTKELNNIEFVSSEHEIYKDRIIYFIDNHIKLNNEVTVPKYLIDFVLLHLESWIENAMIAKLMVEGIDYVVDVDRTRCHPDRYPMITILDRDTGTDLGNSQWDEALHQFLQIKHGCKLSLQKLKAVFISNVSFFKKYNKLYGLTGTLGSKVERELLTNIHSVDFVTIPTAEPRKFKEEAPIVCDDFDSWLLQLEQTTKLRIAGGQPVLLIFDTIKELKEVETAFRKANISSDIKVYQRDYEEFDLTQGNNKLKSNMVILATNLAGRGADIKLEKSVVDAGGLHVCLTYLPRNCRIEQQAFGRSSRCGEPGTGQLVFLTETKTSIIKLKTERDMEECLRLNSVKTYYQNQILIEEKYLEQFTKIFKKKKTMLNELKVPYDIKSILLKTCLNKWAYWLDRYSNVINDKEKSNEIQESLNLFLSNIKSLLYSGPYSNSTKLISCLRKYGAMATFLLPTPLSVKYDSTNMSHLNDKITNWSMWTEDPFIKIQIAKALFNMKYFDEALEILNAIILTEPTCNELAHYYMSAIYLSQIDWAKKTIDTNGNIIFNDSSNANLYNLMKLHIFEAKHQFDELSQSGLQICAIVDEIKRTRIEFQSCIVQVEALSKQKEISSQLYSLFINSIDDILGHAISGQNFVRQDIDNFTGEKIYNNIQCFLNSSRINCEYSKQHLIKIAENYSVDESDLETFLQYVSKHTLQLSDFERRIKASVLMPSREDFWETLEQQKILINLEEFVFVNCNRLEIFDPSLLNYLKTCTKNGTICFAKYDEEKKPILFKFNLLMCENSVLITKENFIKISGATRYEFLIKNSVIDWNVKAEIDSSQVSNINFNHYDIVHYEDFITNLIPGTIVDYIIKSLLDVKILAKHKTGHFKLLKSDLKLIPNDLILYQEHISRVLKRKFIYRLQIESIMQQIKYNSFPIIMTLKSHPHKHIICDLISENILMHPDVIGDPDTIELYIKRSYTAFVSNEDLMEELLEFGLIDNESEFNALIKELKEKNWLKSSTFDSIELFYKKMHFPGETFFDNTIWESLLNNIILPIYNSAKCGLLEINKISERKQLSDPFKRNELTLSVIFNNKLTLSSDDIHKHIFNELINSKSNLYSVEHPTANFKSLSEFKLGGEFTQEIDTFRLNGCDHTIVLCEKKYTFQMIAKTTAVICLGVMQCAVGFGVLVYSTGTMTHFGNALISEGIGDIIYAAFGFNSGHFCWSDYKTHKLTSMAMTAATFGFAAYLSKGTHLSRYGYEIAGKGFISESGAELVVSKGSDLIQSIGFTQLCSTGGKLIAGKFAQSFLLAGFNYFADNTIKNSMNSLCRGLASKIMGEIDQEIHKHEINDVISRLITTCGPTVANSQIKTSIDKHFGKKSELLKEFVKTVGKICSCAMTGVAEASKKISRASSTSNFAITSMLIRIISDGTKYALMVGNILSLKNSIRNILKDIIEDLRKKTKEVEAMNKSYKQSIDDLDVLQNDLLDSVRMAISNEGGKIVEDNLVIPLVNWGTNVAAQYTIQGIKAGYKGLRNYMHRREFESLNKGFAAELVSNPEQTDSITVKYNENLLKLMNKCRSPELFADILKENVPMDATCVRACLNIICQMQGIGNLSVEVKNSSGETQLFTVGSGSTENSIKLNVDANHFVGGDNATGNNCLFAALVLQIPELNGLTPEQFREMVAETIVTDAEIRQRIEQGWHAFGMDKGLLGGAAQQKRRKFSEKENFSIEIQDRQFVNIFKDFNTEQNISINQLPETEVLDKIKTLCQLVEKDDYNIVEKGKDRIIYKDNEPVFVITEAMRDWLNLRDNVRVFETDNNVTSNNLIYIKFCDFCQEIGVNYTGQTTRGAERSNEHEYKVNNLDGNTLDVKHAMDHWHTQVNETPNISKEHMEFLKNPPKPEDRERFKEIANHYRLELPSKIYKIVVVHEMPNNCKKSTLDKLEHLLTYISKSKKADGGLTQRTPQMRRKNPREE